MAHGTAEHKIEVMHDQLTGAGGLSLGIMTMLITALAIGQFSGNGHFKIPLIIGGIIAVEASAKLSMVVMAWAGKSVHQGMNSPFLEAMHGSKGNLRLVAAVADFFRCCFAFAGLGRRFHRLSRHDYQLWSWLRLRTDTSTGSQATFSAPQTR